jgi:TonB family protein
MNSAGYARTVLTILMTTACPALAEIAVKPLTEAQVLDLLRSDVARVRVAELAREKGIDFTLGPDDERRLRRAGADTALIETLRELAPNASASQPVIQYFVSDLTTLNSRATSATLSWSVSDAIEVTLAPDIGRVDSIGHVSVAPGKTTMYTLHALGSGSEETRYVTVEVPYAAIVIDSFAVDDARIPPGQRTHLRWSVSNATSVTIDAGSHALSVPNEGVWSIAPLTTTTYVLLASGDGPSHSRSVTVEVAIPENPDVGTLLSRAKESRTKNDYATAFSLFHEAAELGDPEAVNQVGWMYQNGLGVTRDYAEAMTWFRKAAQAGNGDGMNNIGWLYQAGWGVTQDYHEANEWYKKAADAGNGAGMYNVGWLYQNGLGVTRDYPEAIKWYRQAAENGVADGMNNLGWFYEHGLGLAADRDTAVSWYRKAAAAGNQSAKANLKRLGIDADESSSGTPSRIRIGGNVQAANLIHKVVPTYPPLAAQARIQGTVRFEAVIGENGAIRNLQLVSGHPMLVSSAQQAVSQWRYKPTLLNGRPVEVVTTIDVNFTLGN